MLIWSRVIAFQQEIDFPVCYLSLRKKSYFDSMAYTFNMHIQCTCACMNGRYSQGGSQLPRREGKMLVPIRIPASVLLCGCVVIIIIIMAACMLFIL